jgi:hypothetical protein
MCEAYVGCLTREQFEELAEDALKIHQSQLLGPRWSVVHVFMTARPDIPLEAHYQALAAAHQLPYRGILDFHQHAMKLGILPPWSLNRTQFVNVPTERMLLGELLLELGLITDETLARCVDLQSKIWRELGVRVTMGSVILSVANVSYPDFYQALGIQNGVHFDSLDESAAEIYRVARAPRPIATA